MLKKLSELHQICFPKKPWSEKDFADLKKSGAEIISSDNAFIVYFVVKGEAEIITLGVNPEFRGTGIARAILTVAENEMKKQGAKKVFLEVAEDNLPARVLYDRYGYKQIGLRPKYYGNTNAVLMEKELL